MKKIFWLLGILILVGLIWAVNFYWHQGNLAPISASKENLIRVKNVKPGDLAQSPLIIEGEARGYWFFEASFPVKIFDANGKELGTTIAQAQSEWMTENFVPFRAELKFSQPATKTGFLVLKKDNPSGLPEHDDELRFMIRLLP